MRRDGWLSAFFLLGAAATLAHGYGESQNGFPSWNERVILEWINRARVEPQIEMTACGARCGEAACYAPIAPLLWDYKLNRAARYHADEMAMQGYFNHTSACTV